jgi:hypothetical protein
LKRLTHPLSGSSSWAELDGTTVVRKVWDGRANLAQLTTDAASGHLQVLSLRLYRQQLNGRSILVRNIWSDITADSCRFEQAFSDDGGKTWEVNWIAVDTRMK